MLVTRRASCLAENADIQPKNHQNVLKSHFWLKFLGQESMGEAIYVTLE